jgi:plastocyanin
LRHHPYEDHEMRRLCTALALLAITTTAASAQGITVSLTEWKFEMSKDTVKAGSVTFRVTNNGSMAHSFFVKGAGVAKGTRDLAKGESATLTLPLKAGTYDVYCPMAEGSHQVAGMAHKIVVTAGEAAASAAPAKKKPGA